MGEMVLGVQVCCIYWALCFYYYISSTLDHQASDPGGGGPRSRVLVSGMFFHLTVIMIGGKLLCVSNKDDDLSCLTRLLRGLNEIKHVSVLG